MDRDRTTYALIEDYLMGRSTPEARTQLEDRMASDPAFKIYFDGHKEAHELIRTKEELSIRKQLQQIHAADTMTSAKRPSRLYWGIGLVAVIGILSLLAWSMMDREEVSAAENGVDKVVAVDQEQEVAKEAEERSTMAPPVTKGDQEVPTSKSMTVPTTGREIDVVEEVVDPPSDAPIQTEVKTDGAAPPSEPESTDIDSDPLAAEPSSDEEDLTPEEVEEVSENEVMGDQDPAEEPCEAYAVDVEFETQPTCADAKEGSVQVVQVDMDTYYRYSLDGQRPRDSNVFNGLASGRHSIQTLDVRGCLSEPVSFIIAAIECDIVIAPSRGQFWEIDLDRFGEAEVTLEVYSATSGARVYEKILNGYERNIWEGRSSSGTTLGMGSYTYILRSDRIRQVGEVTVLR